MVTTLAAPRDLTEAHPGGVGFGLLRHAHRVHGDQRPGRGGAAAVTELACLLLFLVALAGIVVVIVIGWPWPLFAVLGVFIARGSVEGILRADPDRFDEPS